MNPRITSLLESAISPLGQQILRMFKEEASGRHIPMYIVGGFVRDLLLNLPSVDFDLVVESDAIALARSLASKYGGKVTTHIHFGTARWFIESSEFIVRKSSEKQKILRSDLKYIDIITARSETYAYPGALPRVKPGTLRDDLCRRDFTINALALCITGERFGQLRDDLGGLVDLKRGIVRILHPRSYLDDPTRILRAVRYEQRYGFQISPDDMKLISEAKPLLAGISGERIRNELDLILNEEKSTAMLARLTMLDVLHEIHPSLKWNSSLGKLLDNLNRAEAEHWPKIRDLPRLPRRIALSYLLWLGHLSLSEIESLSNRIALTASLRNALLASSALHIDLSTIAYAKPSAITERLDKAPLLAVCALSLASESQSVDKYLSHWRHVKPKTTGHALKKRGLPPGPAYQRILRRLRDAWLDGEVDSLAGERKMLKSLINKLQSEK